MPSESKQYAKHYEEIFNVLQFMAVYLETDPPKTVQQAAFRLAPSAVCRSDALLLGVSTPRFGCRGYFGRNKSNFINFRRSPLLVENAPRLWANPKENEKGEYSVVSERHPDFLTPQEFVKKQPLLADAVFTLPEKYQDENWIVITAELGTAHGERPMPRSLPFAQALQLSGTCAPAVLFMASSLLEGVASSVYGLAEISALAGDPSASQLVITSLPKEKIQRAAAAMGLHIPNQIIRLKAIADQKINSEKQMVGDAQQIFDAIRIYVEAGVPVILPVMHARFQKEGGYTECPKRIKDAENVGHAMLAVGISNRRGDDRILIMDPATIPFLPVRASALVNSLFKVSANKKFPEGLEGYQNAREIMPVLPAQVKLGLFPQNKVPSKKTPETVEDVIHPDGLIRLVHRLLVKGRNREADWPSYDESHFPGKFALHRKKDVLASLRNIIKLSQSKDSRGNLSQLEKIRNAIVNKKNTAGWIWLQTISHGHAGAEHVWLWNATNPPRESLNAKDIFLGFVCHPLQVEKTPKLSSIKRRKESSDLFPSIITSCNEGLDEALQKLPEDCLYADLYAFMGCDVEKILNAERTHSAKAMAAMASDDSALDRVIRKIKEILASRHRGKLIFRAIASFIPEAASTDPTVRRIGCRALLFLAKLADGLNRSGHQIQAIEIVGGARPHDMWLGKELNGTKTSRLIGKNAQPEEIHILLAKSLTMAVKQTPHITIPFAVELEPGPLFALNSLEAMENFFNIADQGLNPQQRKRVGMNLDIAHLGLLGGIQASDFARSPLMKRVVHAHVSDFSNAHFADIPLGTYHSGEDFFAPWIDLLKDLPSPFSRTVSMELEMCSSSEQVIESYKALKDLLGV